VPAARPPTVPNIELSPPAGRSRHQAAPDPVHRAAHRVPAPPATGVEALANVRVALHDHADLADALGAHRAARLGALELLAHRVMRAAVECLEETVPRVVGRHRTIMHHTRRAAACGGVAPERSTLGGSPRGRSSAKRDPLQRRGELAEDPGRAGGGAPPEPPQLGLGAVDRGLDPAERAAKLLLGEVDLLPHPPECIAALAWPPMAVKRTQPGVRRREWPVHGHLVTMCCIGHAHRCARNLASGSKDPVQTRRTAGRPATCVANLTVPGDDLRSVVAPRAPRV